MKKPKYCQKCKKRLIGKSGTSDKWFDLYTGELMTRKKMWYICPDFESWSGYSDAFYYHTNGHTEMEWIGEKEIVQS